MYSLISNQYGPTGPTGAQGPTGLQGSTGPQGPTGPQGATGTILRLVATGFPGYSGPGYTASSSNTGGTAYFLDNANLMVTTNNNQTNIINASFQTYVPLPTDLTTPAINNLSATIMRSYVAMTGYNISSTTPVLNLANKLYVNGSTGDVQFPLDNGNGYLTYLNTSLYTISTSSALKGPDRDLTPVNAFTVNMQAIDTLTNVNNGPTGVYYSVRVSTDGNSPNFSTIRLSCIQTG